MSDRPLIPDTNPPQWNSGGWFGAQLGSTCWIAICAGLLSKHDLKVAAIVFTLFLAANIVGTALWCLRDRLSAYCGMNTLLAALGAASLAAVFVIESAGLWHVVEGVGGKVSAGQMYILIVALILGLFALFWSINRSNSGDNPHH